MRCSAMKRKLQPTGRELNRLVLEAKTVFATAKEKASAAKDAVKTAKTALKQAKKQSKLTRKACKQAWKQLAAAEGVLAKWLKKSRLQLRAAAKKEAKKAKP
jgi:ABC-type transporter Mla subunit MlaD